MGKYPSGIKIIPVGGVGLDWLNVGAGRQSMRRVRKKQIRNLAGFVLKFSFMEV